MSCSKNCPINGRWKSNEEKTLQNMKSAELTDKQVIFFKDHFFGQLVIEMDCDGFSTIYEGHTESAKFCNRSPREL